jgi:hypothetical protein
LQNAQDSDSIEYVDIVVYLPCYLGWHNTNKNMLSGSHYIKYLRQGQRLSML